MYKFSQRSLDRLEAVHPRLVSVVHKVMELQVMDFSVVEGVRTYERQKELVDRGVSKTMNSKHLIQDDEYGHAVDLYPYPINMKKVNEGDAREIARFGVLSGLVQAVAKQEGVKIINGMDWDGDGETLDHTFFDAPHFQIMLRG
jgi:peptidoglycan L-alanyl-D-glutamate endopeptidase CwlK